MEQKPKPTREQDPRLEFRPPPNGTKKPPWGFRGKTLWDWLQLLLVPLLLGIFAVGLTAWFNAQQDARQNKIEEQRAETDRQIEEQRAQDAALQAYLDQMSTLLLKEDLRTSKTGSEVRTLARARTATVIQRLDADGNRNVIRFLNEANLTRNIGRFSISLLAQADLQGAHFENVDLSAINLSRADLSSANLSEADLIRADLSSANLSGADLSRADLLADLRYADLSHADLSGAALYYNRAHYYGSETEAIIANLTGADLTGANLEGVTGSKEQLMDAISLRGATMPNGQKYEAWLKSKDSGKDGENSGPS